MEQEILLEKIAGQQEKIDAIYVSVEKLRKYFMWTLIITAATVVLPLVAILIIIPIILRTIAGAYGDLL